MSTRREFLIKLSATAAVLAGVDNLPLQFSVRTTPLSTPDGGKNKEKTMGELLQQILDETPRSVKRNDLEREYVGRVALDKTITNIDRGFWVVSNPSIRAQLLTQRWELRNGEKDQKKKTPQEKIDWAENQGIHPAVMDLCDSAYEDAKDILSKLDKAGVLRDDGIRFGDKIDDALINPGGMARLIRYETNDAYHFEPYSFTNIGDGIALDEIRNSGFSDESKKVLESSLIELCRNTSLDTGLTFHPDKIPGSLRGDPSKNIGGGAITIQFMPDNALKIYKLVKEVTGRKLNIFDLKDATIMAWIFLALHLPRTYNRRWIGYRRGILLDQQNSLRKWNDDENIFVVLTVAIDYFNKFMDDKLKDQGKIVYAH